MKTIIDNVPNLNKAKERKKIPTQFLYIDENKSNYDEYFKDKRFFIRTYGCQANVRDEETIAGMLCGVGAKRIDNEYDADIIIINTCAVRENAEDKVYGQIGNLKNIKTKDRKIIAICGCMVEEPAILEKVMSMFPFVQLYFGTHEIYRCLDLIYQAMKSNEKIVSIESKQGEVIEGLPCQRTHPYKAYVNIMYGCDKFCTYCIVPYTRGKERSRKFDDILKECKQLVDNNYLEITLLGQNVNAYGLDLDEGKDFADLLEAVAKLGIPRLRFMTSHPWNFKKKMIDVIAKCDNIMKFIHLPVQSGSDEILKKMGRRYTREDYIKLVDLMRKEIPSLNLSTDIIVGFPNESEEQFNDTLSLVDIIQYDSAFTFIYSPRQGTPAAKMEDKISYEEKSKRFKELVKHLEISISNSSKKMVGGVYPILVDGVSKTDVNMLSGYAENNKLVHFKGDVSLIGKIVNVKIKESHTYSLIGELTSE